MSAAPDWSFWVLRQVLLPAVQSVWPGLALLWHPTEALPGTAAKIEVFQMRQVLGLPLHHPRDSKLSIEEGYRPSSVGGELTALALLRELHDGRVEVLEEKVLGKRQRSPAEIERRHCAEIKERERQRSRTRRARSHKQKSAAQERLDRQPGAHSRPARTRLPKETDGPMLSDD